MGVPGYFARAIKARPAAVAATAPPVARLFLDFNSAVHQGVGPAATQESVIDAACATLRALVDRVRPTAVVFVAVDGVAPLAKVNQQRSRRFLAHKSRTVTGAAAGFDRNAITPGTAFMDALAVRIRAACDEIAAARGVRAIFSGSCDPGEGEHKIMDFIRRDPRGAADAPDCVYGLDADLILLSMVVRAQTGGCPMIVREADEGGYAFLDVAALIEEVIAEAPAHLAESDRIMNHVVASFLVGNDFLPPLSCQSIKIGCLEKLCRLAREPLLRAGTYELDWAALTRLVRCVADEEDDLFRKQDARYWAARPPETSDPVAVWEAYPLINKDAACRRIAPGTPGWRPRYYDALFLTRDVGAVVAEYLAGLQWTVHYYAGAYTKASTPEWMYRHAYGPTALDVYNHLAAAGGDAGTRERLRALPNYAFSAEAALLMVTPPSSFAVLPPRLAAMATDANFGIAHTFPEDFAVHTYLKRWAHECKAKIPPVDLAAVKKLPI